MKTWIYFVPIVGFVKATVEYCLASHNIEQLHGGAFWAQMEKVNQCFDNFNVAMLCTILFIVLCVALAPKKGKGE